MTMKPTTLALGSILLLLPLQAPAARGADPQTRPATPAASAPNTLPFFAFCMDTHDARKRDLKQQAELLKELGYDGAGHLWLGGLAERLKTLDDAGLKLFQVYVQVDITPGKAIDPAIAKALPLLKGRDTMLALLVVGGKASDPAGDERAVAVVREIADAAKPFGVRVALYPHVGNWLEKMDDALRVIKKADRPNAGVMFNLCHWMKSEKDPDPAAVLKAAMPYLLAVSIHGADTAESVRAGKGNWIQPLDSGTFDIPALLRTLRVLGYRGPIGLQCYGLPGDARDHLARSMAAWRKMNPPLR
jgi:sugar phosphate isomerase/epimerase